MTDISEKQTIEWFVGGIKKASTSAQQLATINKRGDWLKIVRMLDQISYNAKKMYEGKPQTRLQTLALANHIQTDEDKKVLN